MIIADAAALVLREANASLHVRDIHSQIVSQQLFEFKAKDAVSVVSAVLRKSSQFEKTAPGTFKLKQ
jgi:hypothetical protein